MIAPRLKNPLNCLVLSQGIDLPHFGYFLYAVSETVNLARPFALRRDKIFLPLLLAIFERNPWVFNLFRLFG